MLSNFHRFITAETQQITNKPNTLATFNNVTNNQKFFHYYPNSRTFYKLRGNEIDTINIRISDKDYN